MILVWFWLKYHPVIGCLGLDFLADFLSIGTNFISCLFGHSKLCWFLTVDFGVFISHHEEISHFPCCFLLDLWLLSHQLWSSLVSSASSERTILYLLPSSLCFGDHLKMASQMEKYAFRFVSGLSWPKASVPFLSVIWPMSISNRDYLPELQLLLLSNLALLICNMSTKFQRFLSDPTLWLCCSSYNCSLISSIPHLGMFVHPLPTPSWHFAYSLLFLIYVHSLFLCFISGVWSLGLYRWWWNSCLCIGFSFFCYRRSSNLRMLGLVLPWRGSRCLGHFLWWRLFVLRNWALSRCSSFALKLHFFHFFGRLVRIVHSSRRPIWQPAASISAILSQFLASWLVK